MAPVDDNATAKPKLQSTKKHCQVQDKMIHEQNSPGRGDWTMILTLWSITLLNKTIAHVWIGAQHKNAYPMDGSMDLTYGSINILGWFQWDWSMDLTCWILASLQTADDSYILAGLSDSLKCSLITDNIIKTLQTLVDIFIK